MRSLGLVFLAFCALRSADARAAPARLGILPIVRPHGDAGALEAAVLVEPVLAGFALVTPTEMHGHEETAQSLGIVCAPDDDACVARIGAFAKVTRLLAVALDDEAGSCTVRVVDVNAPAKSRRLTLPVAGAEDDRIGIVLLALRSTFGGTPLGGLLRVDGPPGIALTLDGTAIGSAPVGPLAVGAGHHVLVFGSGESARTAPFDAVPGALLRVAQPDASTTARPTPAGPGGTQQPGGAAAAPSAVAVTGLLITGVAGVAAAAVGIGGLVVQPRVDDRDQYTAKEFNDGQALARVLWVTAAAAGGIAVVGLAITGVGFAVE